MQCGTFHLQTVQENLLSHIILATYMKFTVATVRFPLNVCCNIYTHSIINNWQMSLSNNSSENKSYWIHWVNVKVSAQVTTVTYMHQSQTSSHLLRIHFKVHFQLWPGKHLIWCNATFSKSLHELFTVMWYQYHSIYAQAVFYGIWGYLHKTI